MSVLNTRRGLLAGAAVAVAGIGASRTALALSAEPIDVPTQRLMANACHDRTAHVQLLAELAEKLGGITREERQRVLEAAACPFCGCRLAAQD
jgi:hypothetical protein